jgi:hypothetical protein
LCPKPNEITKGTIKRRNIIEPTADPTERVEGGECKGCALIADAMARAEEIRASGILELLPPPQFVVQLRLKASIARLVVGKSRFDSYSCDSDCNEGCWRANSKVGIRVAARNSWGGLLLQ